MSDYLYHHFHVLFELLRAYVRRLSFLEKDRFVHLLGEEARAILEQGDERERERRRRAYVCTHSYVRQECSLRAYRRSFYVRLPQSQILPSPVPDACDRAAEGGVRHFPP